MDVVRMAAVGGHGYGLGRAAEEFDPVGLDQGVDGEGAAGLPLAVEAVTAVGEHRRRGQTKPDLAAGAAAGEIAFGHLHVPVPRQSNLALAAMAAASSPYFFIR